MADPFARMHGSLMARLSTQALRNEAATLRGGPVTVSLEHGVAMYGEAGEVTAYRSIATIPKGAAPAVGDALIVGMASYVIDGIDADNGYVVRVVLR